MKRYVLVGAGARGLQMFARPIVEQFGRTARLAGVFDTNALRARYVGDTCGVPVFGDFATMVRCVQPDTVIVATVDRFHCDYTIRALEAGCNVISEKPLAIDAEQCRAILAAEQRSGRTITVVFNLRLTPYVARIKELVAAGTIGRVLSVNLSWQLDTHHGADYFRRWHRRMEHSGGLLVHKATHHFDMVNWWLDLEPETVFAFGDRHVYGPTRAERGTRCSGCVYARSCEFHMDYASDPLLHALYFAAEAEDGYHRDACVFAEEIDIYDTMSAMVRYASGALLTYALDAHTPYEGWRATINGTHGRLEAQEWYSGVPTDVRSTEIHVYDRHGKLRRIAVSRLEGVHGGGDARLLEHLFGEQPPPDPLCAVAGARAGVMSALIGVAANEAIASGLPVAIADLLPVGETG